MKTIIQLLQEIRRGKRVFDAASEDGVEFTRIVSLLKEAVGQRLLGKVIVLDDADGGVRGPVEATVLRGLTHIGEQFVEEDSGRPTAVR